MRRGSFAVAAPDGYTGTPIEEGDILVPPGQDGTPGLGPGIFVFAEDLGLATVRSSKFAIPHLKNSSGGRIINISSIHSEWGGGGPAYPSAKAAVVNLSRDLAVELGKRSSSAFFLLYFQPLLEELTQLEHLAPHPIIFGDEHFHR